MVSQNAFLNGELERPVYAQLPRHQVSESTWGDRVMLLRRMLCGLGDVSRISVNLFNDTFGDADLEQLKTMPCIFQWKDMIVACCVDDLLIFGKKMAGYRTAQTPADVETSVERLG